MRVPVALAEINAGLRTGQKSVLADLITSGINRPSEIELQGSSCLLIDGLALVSAFGKPSGSQTFGDFADKFQVDVLQAGSRYQYIHVGIKKIPSSQEGEKDAQSQLALSDVLLKMTVSLLLTVGKTSLHCQITDQITASQVPIGTH